MDLPGPQVGLVLVSVVVGDVVVETGGEETQESRRGLRQWFIGSRYLASLIAMIIVSVVSIRLRDCHYIHPNPRGIDIVGLTPIL